MKQLISQAISNIKNAIKIKKLYIKIFYNNKIIQILNILKKNEIIFTFYKYNNKYLIIIFNNKNTILTDFKLISKNKKRIYIKKKQLYILQKYNNYKYILSTTKGVVTLQTALFYKLGGELLIQYI